MSKVEAKKIVREYGRALQKAKYPFRAIYLFGSYAGGKPTKWSDIDVAVITDALKRNYDQNRFRLWNLRLNVDLRIEPHGFTVKDFKEENNPLITEIKQHGIRII